jgi:hypothetical protein
MEDLYNYKATTLTSEVEMSEIDKVIFKILILNLMGKQNLQFHIFQSLKENLVLVLFMDLVAVVKHLY